MDSDAAPAPGYEKGRRTKALLVERAAELFATKGFGGASMEQIASAAGLTKGAVYAHFRSKREVWLACLSWAFEPIKTPAPARAEGASDRLREYLLWLGRAIAGSSVTRAFFLEVIRESDDAADAQAVVATELDVTYAALRSVIQDVRGDVDPDVFAFVAFSALLLDPDLHRFHRLMTGGVAPPHTLESTVDELVASISRPDLPKKTDRY